MNADRMLELTMELLEGGMMSGEIKPLYKLYEELSPKETVELIDYTIDNQKMDSWDKQVVYLYLALYSYQIGEYLPDKLYAHLMKETWDSYPEIFLRAAPQVAEMLIDAAQTDEMRDQIIPLLSAVRSEKSAEFLAGTDHRWEDTAGGWCLEKGKIKELYREEVVPFEESPGTEEDGWVPLRRIDRLCGFCRHPLTLIFNQKEPLGSCLVCSCYQTIYTRMEQGEIAWHEQNRKTEILEQCMDRVLDGYPNRERKLKRSKEFRRITYSASIMTDISHTQLGGLPCRFDHLDYPDCPDCGEKMIFAGQIEGQDIWEWGDGMYYFYVCENCNNGACNYDQT